MCMFVCKYVTYVEKISLSIKRVYMPYRRSYRSRRGRGGMRKRATTRRMYRRSRLTRRSPAYGPVTSFKRTVYLSNWAFSSVSTSGFWRYNFMTFDAITNSAEYKSLFDQYRINGVKFQFRPRWSGADAQQTATPGQNMVYASIYIDPESEITPAGTYMSTTFNTFLENANGKVRTVKCDKPFTVYYKPAVPDSGMVTNGRYLKSPWLSMTNATSLGHRGFHLFFNDANFSAASSITFDIVATVYFQCRGNK